MRIEKADRILLGVLLPLAVIAALLVVATTPPARTGSRAENPSTFYNAPYGAKAAYLVLDRLGIPVTRWRRPLEQRLIEDAQALVILEPREELRSWETEAILDWVRGGGRLLVAPTSPHSSGSSVEGIDGWFHVVVVNFPSGEPDVLTTKLDSKQHDADSILAGITQLSTDRLGRFDPKSPLAGPLKDENWTVAWADADGPVVLRVELGEGEILALADVRFLTNRGLREGDNGLLLANLAAELSALDDGEPAEIAFDEYHHGFIARRFTGAAIVEQILGGPWGYAAAQAGAACLLGLVAAGWRFGKPRDVVHAKRRRHREFAESAGRLLSEAEAVRIAYRILAAHYRERMCRVARLPTSIDDSQLVNTLRRQADISFLAIPPDVRRTAGGGAEGRNHLLSLAQKWHATLEELEHGI